MAGKTRKKELGDLGERAVTMFLMKHGFSIEARNYSVRAGEIDIVAKKANKMHFVEVKTGLNVSRETINPGENLTEDKVRKVARAGAKYMNEKGFKGEWQIDGAVVNIDAVSKKAHITMIWNLIAS